MKKIGLCLFCVFQILLCGAIGKIDTTWVRTSDGLYQQKKVEVIQELTTPLKKTFTREELDTLCTTGSLTREKIYDFWIKETSIEKYRVEAGVVIHVSTEYTERELKTSSIIVLTLVSVLIISGILYSIFLRSKKPSPS